MLVVVVIGGSNDPEQIPTVDESTHLSENDPDNEAEPVGRKKKKSSDVWLYYDDMGVCPDGKRRAKCKGCGTAIVGGGGASGTSSLARHAQRCKKLDHMKQTRLPELLLDNLGKPRNRKIDQSIFRNKLALAIVKHDLPFSFVEYDGIRDVFKYLNLRAKMISRNTIASDVFKLYTNEKERLKDELGKIMGKVCLTFDLWTSCT